MLPAYVFTTDIICTNPKISEKVFLEQIFPCLAALDALQGSLDRVPCIHNLYHSGENENYETESWSYRTVMVTSLGKERAKNLSALCYAISRLIRFELPEKDYVLHFYFDRLRQE